MHLSKKYSEEFLKKSFEGCLNNKTEVLSFELCGCYNCLQTFKSENIIEWIPEHNGKEDSATCPKCTFDSILSSKYPVNDPEFLIEMRKYHFGN